MRITTVTALIFMCLTAPVFADNFNQKNIIELCKRDASFDSTCYTYLAAYRDLLGFFAFSTNEERERLFRCLANPELTTERIAQRLTLAEETKRSGQVADLLLNEFCN